MDKERLHKQLRRILGKHSLASEKGGALMTNHIFGGPLTDHDYEALKRIGISAEKVDAAHWRRVDSVEGREIVGRNGSGDDFSGMLIPILQPGTDENREYILRLDHPPLVVGEDGKIKEQHKYLGPPSRAPKLLFPPRIAAEWLQDTSLPILIVEGPKKALAGDELAWYGLSDADEKPRWLTIGINGVNGWRGVVEKITNAKGKRQDVKGPIVDLDWITWKGRDIILCFDRNIHDNKKVRIARFTLAKELRQRGAYVLFVDLPANCGLNGIDDYIGEHGPEKALALIEAAYDPKTDSPTLTEERLAQEFEAQYTGDMYYDHHRGRWYVWNEEQGRWVLNEKRLAFHFARQVCRELNAEEKKEFARASTYGGVERICQASPHFAVTAEHWDRNIWLLGVPGSTVDLRTGELRAPARDDYITKQTSVAPDFKVAMPVFRRFLGEITQGDVELQRYLQRIAGYALTGSIREEKVLFLYGPGGNGKTKLVTAISDCAGDYAVTAAMEAFTERRGERHSTDIAALAGARLVTASETQKGRRWDEALIGRLTGGDHITARFMRRDNFTYTAQFTLLIIGNHAPELSSVNEANRRRFVIIPLTFQPVTPDEKLADKLRPNTQQSWPG